MWRVKSDGGPSRAGPGSGFRCKGSGRQAQTIVMQGWLTHVKLRQPLEFLVRVASAYARLRRDRRANMAPGVSGLDSAQSSKHQHPSSREIPSSKHPSSPRLRRDGPEKFQAHTSMAQAHGSRTGHQPPRRQDAKVAKVAKERNLKSEL